MTPAALTRRQVMAGLPAMAATVPLLASAPAPAAHGVMLTAAPAMARLAPAPAGATAVWAFNGSIPGPVVRLRQGEPARILAVNGLGEPTSIHWHGLRIPNAMDGVPGVTQFPIWPGTAFLYELTPPDAGTFWYHPHANSAEQVGRGLAGVMVVEEAEPPDIDRDLVLVLDDWRLDDAGTIDPEFAGVIEMTHAGRLGNLVTVNGVASPVFPAVAGERLRLRLANVANARIFQLSFPGQSPVVIAVDGQPGAVEPLPEGGALLGPGARLDLMLDMQPAQGGRCAMVDRFIPARPRDVLTLDVAGRAGGARRDPPVLAPNPLPEPDVGNAFVHDLVFAGGADPTAGMASHDLHRHRAAWTINGRAMDEAHEGPPLLDLAMGRTHRLRLANRSAFHHPIHLHGHSFRLLARGGVAVAGRPWMDTVLLAPQEEADVAFVADNPGDWMIHCHILEHQAAGMMAVLRVS